MKLRIFHIILFVLVSLSASAQLLPNSGFEIWSTDGPFGIPDEWTSSNEFTFNLTNTISLQSSTEYIEGSLSAFLYTTNLGFAGAPYAGWLVNGIPQLDYSTGLLDFFKAGTGFSEKPQVFKGYYRFENNYVSTDSARVYVFLKKFDALTQHSDTVAIGFLKLGPSSIFSQFELPIYDLVPAVSPDSIVIAFTTTDVLEPVSGGVLWIDDLDYESQTGSVKEAIKPQILISPNPATEKITVQPKGITGIVKVNIYNSLGELVKLARMNQVDVPYDISLIGLHRGVYFVKLIDGNTVLETKKLIVQN